MKAILPCPYKGLNPFEQNDEAFFFGRDNDKKIVISSLYGSSLTVLYGASGVGKTSLLRAGVVPELKRSHNVAAVVFRQWQGDDFRDLLRAEILKETLAAVNRWFEAHGSQERLASVDLVSAINQKLELQHARRLETAKRRLSTALSEERTTSQTPVKTLVDFPRLEKLPLNRFMTECAKSFEGRIFFIIDQFEEYFLYHPETGEAAEDFDSQFALAVNSPEIPVSFLVSLRDDGLSKLDRLKDRIPNLFGNIIRLKHLNKQEATAAITKPLEELNKECNLTEAQQISIEDGLVRELLEVKPGSLPEKKRAPHQGNQKPLTVAESQVEMPSLQIVLTRLWEADIEKGFKRCLTKETFLEQGGAVGIVQKYLENRMGDGLLDQLRTTGKGEESLKADATQTRREAAQIFRYLVTAVGSKYAPTVSALADWTNISQGRLIKTLEVLSNLSVVQRVGSKLSEDEPEKRRYEIFHDFLAGAVSQWREAYEKTQAEEEARVEAEKAKAEADEKVRAETTKAREEAEKAKAEAEQRLQEALRRRRNLWLTGVGVLTVAFAILFAITADEKRKLAEEARALAELKQDGIKSLRLADNALLFSISGDQSWYTIPAAIQDVLFVKKIAQQHARDFQVPTRALLALYSAIPAHGDLEPENPENLIPAMYSPDRKTYVTIEDGNQVVVWDEDFVKQYSLQSISELKIRKIGFSKDSSRFAIEGSRKNNNMPVVEEWDLSLLNRSSARWHENSKIEAVLGLIDDPDIASTDLYVKECPHADNDGVFRSYQERTAEWLLGALENVQPLLNDQKSAFPSSIVGIDPRKIDEIPTEQIVHACELRMQDQGKAILAAVMTELSLTMPKPDKFLEVTSRNIASRYITWGDNVAFAGLNGQLDNPPTPNRDKIPLSEVKDSALAFYNHAQKLYPMTSTPENRFRAISLVVEGNNQRKTGNTKAAEESYREALKLLPEYFPPDFDPKKEAVKSDSPKLLNALNPLPSL